MIPADQVREASREMKRAVFFLFLSLFLSLIDEVIGDQVIGYQIIED